MSEFIIATDSYVIRKSEVMIVSPLLKQIGVERQYYFKVVTIRGIDIEIFCTNDISMEESIAERNVFIRSLTN